ncbi:hypothetical protein ACAG26_26905 [Mycobacterium sp. pUA109]|uniref:hypothetical protein n=1 Tax=Mycobacterium sp. pUA109 TaxID=3238982 RepID=UPI00351BD5E2
MTTLDHRVGGTRPAAVVAAAALAIGIASPVWMPAPAASVDLILAAASAAVDPEPTNPVNEWFQTFRADDLAFNAHVEQVLGGTLPASGVPPATPADALVYDVEAPGNLIREDLEALIYSTEYLSHGDFGEAGAILAPVPIDTLQGPVVLIDTNLTGLAEALGVPAADITAINNAIYEPIISLDTTLEDALAALGGSLPNLDPLPDAVSATAADLMNLTDLGGLLSLFDFGALF